MAEATTREEAKCMAEYRKGEDEVQEFLNKMKSLISQKDNIQINLVPWKGNRVNKTLAYMAEKGIGLEDVITVLYELQTSHYSYTADDRNVNFQNEQVWIFGITKNIIDEDVDLYIKLKIRFIHEDTLLTQTSHTVLVC